MIRNKDKAARRSGRPRPAPALGAFRSYLGLKGLRSTQQRRAVLDAVLGRTDHFDAEEVHDGFHRAGSDVSLATIYRTLSLLCEAGVIKETMGDGGRARYEVVYGHAHHDHLLCVRCGAVLEFCDERIEELQRAICRRHGFEALDHRMGIRGVCRNCRQAGRAAQPRGEV